MDPSDGKLTAVGVPRERRGIAYTDGRGGGTRWGYEVYAHQGVRGFYRGIEANMSSAVVRGQPRITQTEESAVHVRQ